MLAYFNFPIRDQSNLRFSIAMPSLTVNIQFIFCMMQQDKVTWSATNYV